MMLPSTLLTLSVTRWGQRRRDTLGVRTFVAGMAPVTLGLVATSGVLLAAPVAQGPLAIAAVLTSSLLTWKTRLHPLWLISAGAFAGVLGWI
jgi:chromate transporter